MPKLALTNPYFGDLEVPAGVNLPLQLQVPFAGTAITPTATLSFNAGVRYANPELGVERTVTIQVPPQGELRHVEDLVPPRP